MIRAFFKVLSVILISTTFLSSQLNVSFTGGNVAPSGSVDVDVSVSGFDNITSFQFSINWDPNVLNYSSIENVTTDLEQFNEGNNIGTPPTAAAVSEGQLTVSWNLQSTEPRSLNDNTRLFTIRLSAVGNACDETMMTLSDDPRQIEVADQNFMLVGATSSNSTVSIDGTDCGMNGGGGNMFSDCDTSCDGSSDTSLSIECVNVDPGATNVCLEVTASNFANMSAVQTAISWDPAVLTYVSLNEIILQNATVNAANAANGLARYIWLQGFADDPVTVADGTVLFEICFDVIGGDGTESFVEFANDAPFNIELSTDLGVSVPFCVQKGLITVGDPDGGNNGGGGEEVECDDNCDGTTDVALIVGCVEIDENTSTACVPITTKNFTNIAAVQIGITWDASVLSYTSITEASLTNIPPPNDANEGQLRIIWLEPTGFNPLTIADDETLFEVCYNFIGDSGDITEINIEPLTNPNFIIEITNGDGVASDPCIQKGFVTQGDTDPGGGGVDCPGDDGEDVCISSNDVSIIIPDVNIDPGTSACIPVTVRNFTNIAGMQFVIDWDPGVLTLDELREDAIDGFSTVVDDATGQIRLVWLIGLNDEPITLADGTKIFDLCYTATGQQGDCTNVSIIDGNGLNIEILDSEASNLPRCIDNGNVTLGDDVGGNDVTIRAENATGDIGSEVCVDITASNWTDIQSAQFNISWDEAVLEYTRVVDTEVLNDFGISNVNLDANNNVRVSWSPINPQTLTGSPVIFEICYNVLGEPGDCTVPSSSIDFVSTNNISIEFTNSNTEVLPFTTQSGSVTKSECAGGFGVTASNISSPSCMDENTGSITVEITGGNAPYTCTWVNAAGNVVASSNTDCNLTNVVDGTYTLTIMDADGMTISQSFTIEPFDLIVTPNIMDQTCDGAGSISLAVSGGLGPYTYSWNPNVGESPNISNIVAGDYAVTITDANGCTATRTFTVNGGGDTGNPLALELSRIDNITCDDGGSIQIDVSGGCPNYSFEWRGPNGEFVSAEDLFRVAPGVWQVTVTDAGGAEITNAFTLNSDIDPIEINFDTSGAACNGGTDGSINVTPTGGCNSYAFTWSGPNGFSSSSEDISGLVAGDYMVTVRDTDNAGILSTRTINVPEVGNVEISGVVTEITNDDGNNGAIDITLTGGTGNLTIAWSDGSTDEDRTGLTAGSYTVSVTDEDQCTSTATFEVSRPLSADDIVLQPVSCFGLSDASIVGQATGGCGGTVIRINGEIVTLPLTDLGIGEYEVTVTDVCGTEVTKIISVTDYQSFVITAVDSCVMNVGESTGMVTLDIQGGSGNFDVSWNAGTISADGQTSSDLPEGEVIAIVDDGCDMQEITVTIVNCDDFEPPEGPGCVGRPIITPNNDGLNDAFVMSCDGAALTQPNNLTIYDRWGNLVFEASNYDNSWMGTDMSGAQLYEAGYMWVLISGTGSDRVIDKGTVTILKTN